VNDQQLALWTLAGFLAGVIVGGVVSIIEPWLSLMVLGL
jgi:hypothetical protein